VSAAKCAVLFVAMFATSIGILVPRESSAQTQTMRVAMSDEQPAVEFSELRFGSYVQARWAGIDAVRVKIDMKAADVHLSWTGTPVANYRTALEKSFDSVRPLSNGTEFRLTIRQHDSGTIAATWNAVDEPPHLREARENIELFAHIRFFIAKAMLIYGDQLQAAMDYAAAIRTYRIGTDELANLYSSPELLDDTGMKLVLAKSRREKGDLETAATLYGRVLESRVAMYSLHHHMD
jgi:hypothetical protein